jgi:hypothetical protein
MKIIPSSDTCSIGSAVDDVKVSVVIRNGHVGGFKVLRNGNPIQPNPDGTVSIGKATTLPGTSIQVVTNITQFAPNIFIEADYILQGTTCGPFVVQDTFDTGDPKAEIDETIKFL